MNAVETVTVASGKEISKGWTPEQEEVIARYQQGLSLTRASAIQKMSRLEKAGNTAAQILAALKSDTATETVEEIPGAVRSSKKPRKAPKVHTPKVKAVKAPKAKSDKPTYDKAQRIKDGICLFPTCSKQMCTEKGKLRRCCKEHMEHFRARNAAYAKAHSKAKK